MATPDVTAGAVMNDAAALMNDVNRTIYPYAIQLPYLNMASQELKEFFELNEIPVVATVSAAITVPANTEEITFEPAMVVPNTPYLPNDLIEPKVLWERQHNVDPYTPMAKLDQLPRWMSGVEINQFLYYTWQSNCIRFLPCNQINDIKMDYIKDLFADFTDEDDVIGVINSKGYLGYKTAALLSTYVGVNPTRAAELNGLAALAMDRIVGIGSKGRQNIFIRRRPFRSGYKSRTFS